MGQTPLKQKLMKHIHRGNRISHLILLMSILSFFLFSCERQIFRNKKFLDLELKQVIEMLGKPDYSLIINVGRNKKLLEFRSSLYEFLGEKSNIDIKELKWVKKKSNLVIWFKMKEGVWISIDTLTWNASIRF